MDTYLSTLYFNIAGDIAGFHFMACHCYNGSMVDEHDLAVHLSYICCEKSSD